MSSLKTGHRDASVTPTSPRSLSVSELSGLCLATLNGRSRVVAAILAAVPEPVARAAAAERAASKWQPGPAGLTGAGPTASTASNVAVLELLLQAGADPFALLPRLLPRYERSVQLEPRQPFYEQFNACRDALAAVLRSQQCHNAAAGNAAGCTPQQHCQLLLAALYCRDAALCSQLIASATAACWARHAANCHLLVAAAEHDMHDVVSALLALCTADGTRPFVVAPPAGMPPLLPGALVMAHEGCTPLMAAAERNSCAALRVLLASGAAVNAADEDGVSALHWAVIGGAYEAAQALLQAGANPSQPCAAEPSGLHLERPLLTAVKEGHCRLARLLLAHGASIWEGPTPGGCTPLSVAVACEQPEAARMLLRLGADAHQILPPEVNGGRFRDAALPSSGQLAGAPPGMPTPPPGYATLLGLAASRRIHAGPLIELLLDAGASPVACTAGSAASPLAEAAAAGAVEGTTCLLRRAQRQGLPLLRLGWLDAAVAAAGRCLASDAHHEVLCTLLDAWQAEQRAQQAEQEAPLPGSCAAVVAALLAAHTQQQQPRIAAAQELDAACELHAVLLAERLSGLGISADLTAGLPTAPHNRNVAVAALPAARRWSPHTHRFFPAAFKTATRQLLLAAARQQREGGAAQPPAGASLASLPHHLLLSIIQLASAPVSFWLDHPEH